MKVAVIGGTGFVGVHLVERLLQDGHTPRLLVRPSNESKVPDPAHCESVSGDIAEESALDRCMEGADAAVYLIGILREVPPRGITFEEMQHAGVVRAIDAAKRQGVTRFVLMSANGIEKEGTAYQRTKYQAEQALKSSGLRWTIFRPSVIYGDPRGRAEFCTQLKRDIIDSPLPAPLFFEGLLPKNAGAFELAPVHVDDVASAFAKALAEPRTESQTYTLCGPDRLSWRQILTAIAAASGRTKWMLPAPALAVGTVASLLDRFQWFPITRDQLTMLLQGNVCSENDSFARLGMVPTRFGPESLRYLRG